jgi:glycine cleavage system H lipoate-binding protein
MCVRAHPRGAGWLCKIKLSDPAEVSLPARTARGNGMLTCASQLDALLDADGYKAISEE